MLHFKFTPFTETDSRDSAWQTRYLHRETLCFSRQGRPVELLTLTAALDAAGPEEPRVDAAPVLFPVPLKNEERIAKNFMRAH